MILSRVVKGVAKKVEQRPAVPPQNLMGLVLTLAKAMIFVYSETLGKWHLWDLSRAILYAIMDKILVPAFTVVRDRESKCLFVFIRGTQSLEDTLTDAMGAPVPFQHKFICSISHDGEVTRNTISGQAHCGMVAAADWIEQHCTSILLRALRDYPDYKVKIVGHSLGGGTAALLTYRLRETRELSTCTCVTFGPGIFIIVIFAAACVSLELAEFGKPFIISVINDSDIVPTLSASSISDFISEVKIKHKALLNAAHRAITAIESHLPLVSGAKAIANHAVTSGAKVASSSLVYMFHSILHWSQHENIVSSSNSKSSNEDESNFSSDESDYDDDAFDEDDEQVISGEELLKLLEKLELESQDITLNMNVQEKKEATTKEITEENRVVHNEEKVGAISTLDNSGKHPLYPPGRIMHIVPSRSFGNLSSNHNGPDEKHLYLYETPKQLYGKLRLSKGMIFDHMTNKYKKMLHQLIDQLENKHYQYGG
uniref:Sn1-specific diacylglycerol lipase alpha n=1 Tax=Cajanus cajan TaxID=3821 RepID=A0A151THF4_CAJCA|nr:Sn1-specific diacylglycerol lipase alpha [Cajanus cajan]